MAYLKAMTADPPKAGLEGVAAAAKVAGERGLPPVHLWHPAHCGEIDIVIRKDGTWVHEGGVIGREALVRLFSTILLISNWLFNKNLMRALLHEKIALPLHAWNRLNLTWSLFFAVLGFINLYVAFNYTTDAWVNFKLFGFTGLMVVFILAQSVWLAKYVDEKKESN